VLRDAHPNTHRTTAARIVLTKFLELRARGINQCHSLQLFGHSAALRTQTAPRETGTRGLATRASRPGVCGGSPGGAVATAFLCHTRAPRVRSGIPRLRSRLQSSTMSCPESVYIPFKNKQNHESDRTSADTTQGFNLATKRWDFATKFKHVRLCPSVVLRLRRLLTATLNETTGESALG